MSLPRKNLHLTLSNLAVPATLSRSPPHAYIAFDRFAQKAVSILVPSAHLGRREVILQLTLRESKDRIDKA